MKDELGVNRLPPVSFCVYLHLQPFEQSTNIIKGRFSWDVVEDHDRKAIKPHFLRTHTHTLGGTTRLKNRQTNKRQNISAF